MNKFIVLLFAVAVSGEAPGGYGGGGSVTASRNFGGSSGGGGGSGINEYVDQALLNRVAALISSGGDGSASQQDNEGSQYVDAGILSRVSSSLDSGSSRGISSEYGAPAPSGSSSLGNPEPAQRIAEFDLATETRGSTGGYQGQAPPQQGYGAPAQQQQPQTGYSTPQRSSGGVSGGAITLGQPETAQRIAEFDATSVQQQGRQQQGGRLGGNQGGYN